MLTSAIKNLMETQREKTQEQEKESLNFHTESKPSEKAWPELPGAPLTHRTGYSGSHTLSGTHSCQMGWHPSTSALALWAGVQVTQEMQRFLLSLDDSLVPLLLLPPGPGKVTRARKHTDSGPRGM